MSATLIKSANMSQLLDRDIRKIMIMAYKSVNNPISMLYDIMASSVGTEKIGSVGDLGGIGEFQGTVDYMGIEQEDETIVSHTEYVGGIQIQRPIMDDDQHNVIKRLPKQLGERMAYRRQQDGASIFNNSFSSLFTYGFGKSLCNDSHDAASSSTTWDNTNTLEFTPANIKANRLSMRKFTSPANNIVQILPNLVVIPIDKEDKAKEIFRTQKGLYTTNHTENILNDGSMSYLAWEFLTSTTAWWTVSKSLMKDNLLWFNRKKTEFNKDLDTDTYIKKWSSYMRYSQTTTDFRWILGSNATQ